MGRSLTHIFTIFHTPIVTTTKEQFERRISILQSFYAGMNRTMDIDEYRYADGFLTAVNIWASGDDYREGFRRVVDAEQNGITDGVTEAETRGFEDALRLFQQAKGL